MAQRILTILGLLALAGGALYSTAWCMMHGNDGGAFGSGFLALVFGIGTAVYSGNNRD